MDPAVPGHPVHHFLGNGNARQTVLEHARDGFTGLCHVLKPLGQGLRNEPLLHLLLDNGPAGGPGLGHLLGGKGAAAGGVVQRGGSYRPGSGGGAPPTLSAPSCFRADRTNSTTRFLTYIIGHDNLILLETLANIYWACRARPMTANNNLTDVNGLEGS